MTATKCPAPTWQPCQSIDGLCRQPMKVWVGCEYVNEVAEKWLHAQGYTYDGVKLEKLTMVEVKKARDWMRERGYPYENKTRETT